MSKKIIRIDIETAPLYALEKEMPPEMMELRKEKYREGKAGDLTPWEFYREKSSLYAEFSRIVCISIGYEKGTFVTKSYFGHDEKALLQDFYDRFNDLESASRTFGGHNINGFDLGVIRKRMVITGVCNLQTLPPIFNTLHYKPWEIDYIDTMQIFQMGKATSASLAVMCLSLGVPTSKDDISGKDVGKVFYSGKKDALDRITKYCEKDVYVTYLCYCKIHGLLGLPMDGHKPFIDEECKAIVDGHGEDSIPLWGFSTLVSGSPYLSPTDSKSFMDYIAKYTEFNAKRNALILSRKKIK